MTQTIVNQQQFQQGLVFVKTLQGEEEVRSRRLQMDRNVRLVLILVDGVSAVADLMAKVPNENVPSALAQLWRDGLIEPNSRTSPPDDLPPDDDEMAAARQAVAESTPPPDPEPKTKPGRRAPPRVDPVVVIPEAGGPLTVDPNSPVASRSMPPVGAVTVAPITAEPVQRVREMTTAEPVEPRAPRQPPAWLVALRNWRPTVRSVPASAAAVRKRGLVVLAVVAGLLVMTAGLPWVPLPWQPRSVSAALQEICGAPPGFFVTRMGILPAPRLLIGPLTAKGRCTSPVERVEVRYGWAGALSGKAEPVRLTVRGLDLDLAQLRTWQPALRSTGATGLESVKLERATLRWSGQQWEDLTGEAKLDAGGVTSVALRNDTGTLQWLSERRGEGWGFELGLKPFKLPGAGIELADAQFRGTWFDNQITVSDVNVFTSGGRVRGNLVLTHADGEWRGLGRLEVRQLDLALWAGEHPVWASGDVDGAFDLLMRGTDPASVFKSSRLNGQMHVHDGILMGLDVLELAQSDSGRSPGGGRTLFVDLNAALQAGLTDWQLEGIRLRGAAMEASGRMQQLADGAIVGQLGVGSAKLRLPTATWRIDGKGGRWNLTRTSAAAAPAAPETPASSP